MGSKGCGDEGKKTRFLLEPFRSEEERLEALESLQKYLRTLKSWKDAERWKAEPRQQDRN